MNVQGDNDISSGLVRQRHADVQLMLRRQQIMQLQRHQEQKQVQRVPTAQALAGGGCIDLTDEALHGLAPQSWQPSGAEEECIEVAAPETKVFDAPALAAGSSDDELIFLGSTGSTAKDFPHAREHCMQAQDPRHTMAQIGSAGQAFALP